MIDIEFAVAGWNIYDLFQRRSWFAVPRAEELVIAQLYIFPEPNAFSGNSYNKALEAAPQLSGKVSYSSWDGKDHPTVLIYLQFSKDITERLVILDDRLNEARMMRDVVLYNRLVREFERGEK